VALGAEITEFAEQSKVSTRRMEVAAATGQKGQRIGIGAKSLSWRLRRALVVLGAAATGHKGRRGRKSHTGGLGAKKKV